MTVLGTVMCTRPGRYVSSFTHPSLVDPAQITGRNLFSATATYTSVRDRSSVRTGSLVAGMTTLAVNERVSPLTTLISLLGVHGTLIP